MRRFLPIFLLLFSVLLFGIIGTGGGNRLSVYLVPADVLDTLMAERTETWDLLVTEISIDQFPLMYDCLEDRWFYSISENARNRSDPFISYEVQGGLSAVKLAFDGSGMEGRLLAFTEDSYHLYHLVTTTLPLINIEHHHDIPYSDEVPMTMTLFDNRANAERAVITSDGTIHLRGNSTAVYPKHSYKMTLTTRSDGRSTRPNNLSLLGMRQDNDWQLYAAYNDQEKIRNVFSSNLWFETCARNNRLGLENGNEYRYVELFLNHEYTGLYALGFPIGKQQLALDDGEVLYKKINWKDTADGYELKFGDPEQAWALLREYDQLLIDGEPEKVRPAADMDNAIDIWLFTMLMQGTDHLHPHGQYRNYYLTFKAVRDGYLLIYTPWDMDMTWGNAWDADAKNYLLPYVMNAEDNSWQMTRNPAAILLSSEEPEMKKRVSERYAELRAGAWSEEALDRMLERFEQQIFDSGAYERERSRWPDGNYLEADQEQNLSLFRAYVQQRLRSMDEFMETMK